MEVVLVTVGLLIAGLLVGRTWVMILPVLGWPIAFLVAYSGASRESTMGMIVLLVVAYILLGAAAVAAGLYLRRFVGSRKPA